MTVITPAYIPEDAWVRNVQRIGKTHRVFSTNGDVLTWCGRWLNRAALELRPEPIVVTAVCLNCAYAKGSDSPKVVRS